MLTFLYDGTYAGLLTAVFETYALKCIPDRIVYEKNHQPALQEKIVAVQTDEGKASRVLKGIAKKCSAETSAGILKVFLSEITGVEMLLYRYIKHLMAAVENVEEDYANPFVLNVQKLKKQIHREVHRMHAFVRFEKTSDDLYYATIEPDFNVLPLIGEHFEKRYADQRWIIFDVKRKYALYYNLTETTEVYGEELEQLFKDANETPETSYQRLWKNYFDAVNIKERKNVKLHLQHLPKRYWKFLTEKKLS